MNILLPKRTLASELDGVNIYLLQLTKHLQEAGEKPYLLTLKSKNICFDEKQFNLIYFPFFQESFPWPLYFTLGNFFVKKLMKDLKIDILHFQSVVMSIFYKYLDKPIIVNAHGFWAEEREKRHGDPLPIVKIKEKIEKFGLNNADYVIVACQSVKDGLLKINPNLDNIVIIPNSVDTNLFSPVKRVFDTEKLRMLTVQRLVPHKGIQHVLKAMPDILKSYPNLEYIIVGDGYYRSKLEELTKKLKIEKNVRFLGFKPHEEIHEWMNKCDVFIFSSLETMTEEALSTPVLEAMSCGKVVLATKTGGVKEVIKDNKNGFFIKPGSSKQITDKILQILDDIKLMRKISKNARKTILEKYSWKQNIKQIIDLYKQALEEKS